MGNKRPAALLSQHPLLASSDLDQVREITGKLWARHEVTVRGRKPFQTLVNSFQAPSGDFSLSFVDCPSHLRVACSSGALGPYSVHLHLGGGSENRIHGIRETSDRGRAVVMGPGQDLVMMARPTRVLVLAFSPAWMEKALATHRLPGSASDQWISGFTTRTGPGQAFRAACLKAAHTLNQPIQGPNASTLLAHLGTRLKHLFLDCLQGAAPGKDQPTLDLGLARLKALEEWMANHVHQPLGIDDLARQADLCPRAVQMAFRQHRGITPMEFLRNLRLDAARKQLTEGGFLTVGEVALRLGFTHVGRFATHYRHRFGESPAQTLRNHPDQLP